MQDFDSKIRKYSNGPTTVEAAELFKKLLPTDQAAIIQLMKDLLAAR